MTMEDIQPPLFFIEGNPVCQLLKDRYCDVCGIYIDTDDMFKLFELHGVCWHEYRRRGKLYKMPGCIG